MIRDESMDRYMQSSREVHLLSVEEERALAERIKAGDEKAREQLITANLRLVMRIAHDFENCGLLPYSDLVSEGNIGMMRAADKFDPDKGAKFSSYAAWWIKQSMRKALSNQGRTVRYPVQAMGKILKIRAARNNYKEIHGREPSIKELSDASNLSVRVVTRLMHSDITTISLSELVEEGGDRTVGDSVTDKTGASLLEEIATLEDISRIRTILEETLEPREMQIIYARYGLDGTKPKTLEEISRIIGRTRERVRQVQNNALRKLRNALGYEHRGLATSRVSAEDAADKKHVPPIADPTRIREQEIIEAYRSNRRNIAQLSRQFYTPPYGIEAILIKHGIMEPDIDLSIINKYLQCGRNASLTSDRYGIPLTTVCIQTIKYRALLEWQKSQAKTHATA